MATIPAPPPSPPAQDRKRILGKVLIYAALIFWTFVSLFPIFWTVTTSFKIGGGRHPGPHRAVAPIPAGLEGLALARTFAGHDRPRPRRRATSSSSASTTASSSPSARRSLAVVIGSLAAYGLTRFDYKFGPWRNKDISFFFLSQLILPPVVLAMPFLVLYKELALLDTRIGLILVYTLMVLPIVIWIMRDQFGSIPIELEQAALVDG